MTRFERQMLHFLYRSNAISVGLYQQIQEQLIPSEDPDLQESTLSSLEESLLDSGEIDQLQWLKATASVLGMRFFDDITIENVNVDHTQELKPTYAKRFQLLPLWVDDQSQTLLVGVSNPFNLEGIDAVRHLFENDLETVIVPQQELLDFVAVCFLIQRKPNGAIRILA